MAGRLLRYYQAVMDVGTRTIYECPSLGGGSWESAAILDTGRTDTVALILAEDARFSATGPAPLRRYVGLKNPVGNFLEREGLFGGTGYHWDPVGAVINGTMIGLFAVGNGSSVNGTWVVGSAGAALFSKLEDAHTNMEVGSVGDGLEAAFASQGVFTVDLSAVDFVAGGLGVNRDSLVSVFFDAGRQAGDLVYTPLFVVDLAAWKSWATGATETVTSIEGDFEGVVCEDAVLVGADPVRFGLVRLEVLDP